ncbi:DUF6065 family protein [Pseudoroseomonas globiformis]|uniref:DUF6065 family protein n=1 Tax=Teichococcus globiformis TaxID=2307229 RepID=A0ABV7G6U8_9PROT
MAALSAAIPFVTFHRMIDTARLPERADRSAGGSLPIRAVRHCDAVTSAAGFGWHLHAPMDFDLIWDGAQIWWHCAGLEGWMPLGSAQFPHFASRFDAAVPEEIRGYSPPFLTALQEPGVVQMWTGLAARTAPGWSLLLRPLANLPRHPAYEPFEGMVEADHWFGPLFTNIRLTRTGMPISFRRSEPLLQAQPVPQIAYSDAVLASATSTTDLEAMSAADWADYHRSIVVPNQNENHRPGAYAAEARKRRKSGRCPFGHG